MRLPLLHLCARPREKPLSILLRFGLPDKLRSELDLARCCNRGRLKYGIARNVRTPSVDQGCCASAEVGSVEYIERLSAELYLQFLAEQIVILEERKIKIIEAWGTQRIAAQVAQRAGCREREALQLDVVVRMAWIDRVRRTARRRIVIRSLAIVIARAGSGTGPVGSDGCRERHTALYGENSAQFPT